MYISMQVIVVHKMKIISNIGILKSKLFMNTVNIKQLIEFVVYKN